MGWLSSIAVAQNPNSNAGGLNWKITRNQATTTDFIGTTNTQKLVLKCNSITALEIAPNSESKFMGDVFLEKLKPVIPIPPDEVRIVTSDNNGKLTSLDKSGLLGAIYTSPSTCLSTGVNVGLPIWSALANANFGVLYTGIDCPARVGIGTNNPVSALQVVGTGFFQGNLGVNIAPTTTEVLKISNPINRTGIEITNNHPTVFALKYGIKNIVNNPNTIAYSVTDQATNQDVFVVKGDGSVGVGTNSPTTALDINGQITMRTGATAGFIPISDASGTMTWVSPFSVGLWQLSPNNPNNIFFNTGNVGIGTNNPLEAFQIGEEFTFHSGGTKAIARNYYFDNATQTSKRIKDGTASALRFNEGGSIDLWTITNGLAGSTIYPADVNKGLHIANNGNVGIGTTAVNGAKLSVEGFVRAREVIVNLSTWSDFVFETTYTLRTLPQVEQYVLANKHLPDVPSEKEVLENGVSLGEMNAVLLQKVEELTLYMIEMNKQLELLKAENKAMKNK